MQNDMKKVLFSVFILTLLVSCGTHTVVSKWYSPTPIKVECAYKSIKSMEFYDFTEKNQGEIVFYNKSVSGKLKPGGSVSFKSYSLELQTTRPLGPDLKVVADKLIGRISTCTHKKI